MSGVGRPRTVASSGFSTVDVMLNGSVRASPGGTATNVVRALRSMGWSPQLIGTIGDDRPGRFLRESLQNEGIGVQDLLLEAGWTTPVIVQEAHRGDHVWRFKCPVCGASFAKHRPSPERRAIEIGALDAPDVFFFDRVSLFTLKLASLWKARGSFVVFEPAGLGRSQLFPRAVEVADLVKYSSERAPAFEAILRGARKTLVETRGSRGTAFRLAGSSDWVNVPVRPVEHIVDSAGAGDWTTAGILDDLIRTGGDHQLEDSAVLRRAVERGQVEGARACGWEGVHPQGLTVVERSGFEVFGCPRVLGGGDRKYSRDERYTPIE